MLEMKVQGERCATSPTADSAPISNAQADNALYDECSHLLTFTE